MEYLAFRYTKTKYKLPIDFNDEVKRVDPADIEERLKDKTKAILLSGGLDSSLLAAINKSQVAYVAHFPIGFTLLVPFFLKDDKRIEYTGNNNYCVSWPKHHLEKFETIDYKGHTLNVPNDYKGWLKHYFGPDWKEENLEWQWVSGAKNLNLWKDLME